MLNKIENFSLWFPRYPTLFCLLVIAGSVQVSPPDTCLLTILCLYLPLLCLYLPSFASAPGSIPQSLLHLKVKQASLVGYFIGTLSLSRFSNREQNHLSKGRVGVAEVEKLKNRLLAVTSQRPVPIFWRPPRMLRCYHPVYRSTQALLESTLAKCIFPPCLCLNLRGFQFFSVAGT